MNDGTSPDNAGHGDQSTPSSPLRDTALAIVDPYNDFMSPDGKLYPRARETIERVHLVENLVKVLAASRQAGVTVFYVPHRRYVDGQYDGWRFLNPTHRRSIEVKPFALGTWGGEFRNELAPIAGDVVISEHWFQNGFANTDLDFALKQHDIRRVLIAGMLANTCIDSTARFAVELGYHVTLISDAVAAYSWEAMRTTLEINAPTYAHRILTTAETITELGQAPAATTAR